MSPTKILVFAGSTRSGSYNKMLSKCAAEALRKAGADVTWIDLRDLALPLYDGDFEEKTGLPEGAKKLKAAMQASDGYLISSPEYNSSITGVLKNAIDWASRTESDDEPALIAFRGKVAALVSASPGALGGLRSLVTLRSLLGNIGVVVLPDQLTISHAYEAFGEGGQLKDEKKAKQLAAVAKSLVHFTTKVKG
jgi:chromate reductase